MVISEERIKELFVKDIQSKTILADISKLDKIKEEYLKDGWKFVKETPINEQKVKVTFQKVK